MKTLEINTGIGTVVLTYSESAKKWGFFSGNQEAMKSLEQAAEDMGWVYNPKLKNYITNFIAENAEKFVSKEEDKDVSNLWDQVKITEEQKQRISELSEKYGINEDLSEIEKDNDGSTYYYFKSAFGNGFACIQNNGEITAGNLGYFEPIKK